MGDVTRTALCNKKTYDLPNAADLGQVTVTVVFEIDWEKGSLYDVNKFPVTHWSAVLPSCGIKADVCFLMHNFAAFYQ